MSGSGSSIKCRNACRTTSRGRSSAPLSTRIVVAKIPHIGNSPYQRLDNDVEPPRAVRIENLPEISGGGVHNLRQRFLQALDFSVVNRLHLPPELANLLFLIVTRKKFAESQKRDHIGRQFVTPQDWLKPRSGPRHQPKPQVSGKCCSRVAQFVLAIELANRIHGWPALLAQTLAHLGTEGGPIVRADVRFKTRSEQRAHGREHSFAAIHVDGGFLGSLRARGGSRCPHFGARLRL